MFPLQRCTRKVLGTLSSCISLTGHAFLDVLFPCSCLVCSRLLEPGALDLCDACRRGLQRVTRGDDLFMRTLGKLQAGGVIDDLIVPFYFMKDGPLQALIHELKYGGMRRIGVELGKEIGRCLAEEGRCKDISGVLPVPLHRARLRERGYNQSQCLCQGISAVTGIPTLERVLVRQRNTATQTALSVAERLSNVHGAFAVRMSKVQLVRRSRILLVDDVITTGATIRACASVLRLHGSECVFAATVAVAT